MNIPTNTRYGLLFGYARQQWRMLAVIVALMLASGGVAALQPLPMKILVDYGLRSSAPPAWLSAWLATANVATSPLTFVLLAAVMSLGVFAVQSLPDAAMTWCTSLAGQRMVYQLANDLFRQLLRLSLRYHSRTTVGDSLSRLTGDIWCVYTFASGFVMGSLQQLLVLGSVATVAFSLDYSLAWISLGMAPLLALSSLYFGRQLKTRAKQSIRTDASLLSFVQQTLTALPLVQAFAAEDRNQEHFRNLARDAISLSKKGALLSSSFGMVNGAITTMGTAVILYVGGMRVLAGTLPLGSLLVFLAYMQTLHSAMESLLKLYGMFKPLEASIDRIAETMQSADFVPETADAIAFPPALPGVGGQVRFEGITFGYDPGRPVLHDIDLEARPGELIALVGHTGAGKSSLVSLIPRLFDPWAGRVCIDGRNLRDLRIADVRSRVSVLLQEAFLFPLSVGENIRLGRPEATRDEIVNAARAAGAHTFIAALPQGYDTILGERGATLSGGERQRIAIARAFLKDAPILILDEPSSALDSQTEMMLLDSIDRLMSGRTVFIIAHRLSTVRRASRIVVLENGRVVESGPHAELLAARRAYTRYYRAQFGRDIEKVPA
jgi:ATP-binding cassette, subfamily B, bacterial